MTRRRYEIPKPAIADVLKELGATDIPTGYGWVRMRCPFHEDRTPSAAVHHEKDAFACHSCGRKGDALKLLQTELRLSWREACERAAALLSGPGNGIYKGASRKNARRRPSDLLKRGG